MYGYGYWWLRTKDDMTIRPELLAACAPIRRQLLGVGTNANGFFSGRGCASEGVAEGAGERER